MGGLYEGFHYNEAAPGPFDTGFTELTANATLQSNPLFRGVEGLACL